ncbi:uncharacterized protein [Physcomitrium patens]|uniref:PsbP C-terminal domain-containing protein n=1 Tax=Physcomitrium patens TaxID=3218 RepID=A0A2K1JVM7_PHYPA|nr:uncharacterized protein LOC112288586 [Physcomitrium patens]PNR45581.1 hypothetical protein PHYPA_015352 [Physcomitrium patens]|eukprot:XP_024388666.1 uncharacterized protein LOC112288586 [Physcomitrella patens]
MAMALAGLQTAVAGSVSIYPAMPESTLRKRVAGRARSRCRGGGDARDERLLVSSMSQVGGFNFDISEGRHAAADELVIQSRRSFLQTGATLASLAVLDRFPALAEPAEIQPEAPVSQEALAGDGTATAQQSASKPKKSRVNTDTWYRFRGEGFTMKYPPDFEDIVEYDESGSSLYGERAKERPFAARFASPDRKEVLSVVVRNASQLKLSFYETQDITEFGTLEEAAKMFVPAGSKIVAAAALKPTDSRIPRTYYLYEFLAKNDKRVAMSAAAAGGRVFVFGAMAPNSRWNEVGSKMRTAAVNFSLPS